MSTKKAPTRDTILAEVGLDERKFLQKIRWAIVNAKTQVRLLESQAQRYAETLDLLFKAGSVKKQIDHWVIFCRENRP